MGNGARKKREEEEEEKRGIPSPHSVRSRVLTQRPTKKAFPPSWTYVFFLGPTNPTLLLLLLRLLNGLFHPTTGEQI